MLAELLPYFERELDSLTGLALAFAQRYPKIASRLQVEEGEGEDPHVERLVEAFALLAARIHRRMDDDYPEIIEAFNTEALVHTGDDLPDRDYLAVLAAMPALDGPARRIAGPSATDGELASAVEFVLEGLYLTKRLAKDASGARALYRSRNR